MGSALSRSRTRVGATASRTWETQGSRGQNEKKAQQIVTKRAETKVSSETPVTARLQNTSSSRFTEKSKMWANVLNNLSGSIKSSSWEDDAQHASDGTGDNRHSAQRSEEYIEKLPSRPAASEAKRPRLSEKEQSTAGRLTQNQVLALFSLRRKDPKSWTATKLAERFRIHEEDAQNLLVFTRTYTGRRDQDDLLRGYYKVDKDDTIVRFERD